ncbi:uncharacterized protein LOC126743324 [Anthonomus grandis grandis]|uniref:uncharacterized protein LOC126743324 n=1 Tax=Anthonomus grandis grandis TaxID=2921223 RepID=UPI0021659783|nr:uncharacterized protein LOC126743324 [Anthonomus grandis grandis]
MDQELEAQKKARKVYRGSFTRTANELANLLDGPRSEENNEAIRVLWETLKPKAEDLKVRDSAIFKSLLEDASEDELSTEVDSCDMYIKRFCELNLRCEKLFVDADLESSTRIVPSVNSMTGESQGKRKFKLPRIELKPYDGSVQGWLSFWSQFQKIHSDSDIDDHDKTEYLWQTTIPGSRARQLVESFPVVSENYVKIIDCMQSRFGNKDMQIEVYIRELLKLILGSATGKQKVDITMLHDKIETQLRALETLGITTESCSALLFPLIESCLPPELLRVWQRSPFSVTSVPSDVPDDPGGSVLELRLKGLMKFLSSEVENEQRISLAADGFGLTEHMSDVRLCSNDDNFKKRKSVRGDIVSTAAGLVNCDAASCIFCGGSHESASCFKANKMSLEEKKNILSSKKACFRCLKVGHQSRRCRGRFNCVVCEKSHLVLMCPSLSVNQVASKQEKCYNGGQSSDVREERTVVRDQTLANYTNTYVFLQTLRVQLKGLNGYKSVRALVDSGSQRSYILKSTAAQLEYKSKRSEKVIHCLFGGREAGYDHQCYDITLSGENFVFSMEALDQPIICSNIPPIFSGQWSDELADLGIQLSDSQDAGPIELLLGADVAGILYTGNQKSLSCGLMAIETRLGWTVIGKVVTNVKRNIGAAMTTLNLFVKDASIEQLWELDTLGIKEPTEQRTKEEMAMAAKQLFLETVRINDEGRYEVRLPWVDGHPPLPSNYCLAQKRLKSNITKLRRDGLFQQCDQVFKEWEAEKIIERINPEVHVNKGHYLPHRVVIKDSSMTTKLRPVFDASAHEKNKPSLNNCLEKGLNLVELIPSLLLRFREYKLGVIADIRKAFLQISVHENDRDFLRFLWEDDQHNEVVFRFRRVVFGVNSSPFLLGVTLEYHLEQFLRKGDRSSSYSRDTIERLRHSFYVDNCVTSVPDGDTLAIFIRESVAIMAEGQFELRGWEHTRIRNLEKETVPCPVLGLIWHPDQDVLTLNPGFLEIDVDNLVVTKREILSLTQKVFDPIGFTSATVLLPKLLLQKLWVKQLTWDETVDEEYAQVFKRWLRELPYLMQIRIARWTLTGGSNIQDVSIHTFCDASKDSYACAIFLRVVVHQNVFLLASKARVSPLKKMTIPRLELLAAVIGARLFKNVRENLNTTANCYFWSDSSTVISWIQRKDQWGTFVWNRVMEIRKLTIAEHWRHIPGACNPADLPSRGCFPKQLFEAKWWEGPTWLYQEPDQWPLENPNYNEKEILQERRKQLVLALADLNIQSE